jgi:hypothetical protein
MSPKRHDTRSRARVLIDAYIEALVGLFALRLRSVQEAIRKDAPEMSVLSSYDGEHIILAAGRVANEAATSGAEIVAAVDQTTSAFVAAMWDLLTTHTRYDAISTQPEVLFFRHLRNACGHDGRWNFADLKHPSRWRDKSLSLNDSGRPVFGSVLKHGDVILIFRDIDRKFFEQSGAADTASGYRPGTLVTH